MSAQWWQYVFIIRHMPRHFDDTVLQAYCYHLLILYLVMMVEHWEQSVFLSRWLSMSWWMGKAIWMGGSNNLLLVEDMYSKDQLSKDRLFKHFHKLSLVPNAIKVVTSLSRRTQRPETQSNLC